MANNNSYQPDPESLGRKRFPDNQSYRAELYGRASSKLSLLLDLIASNYPADTSTNLSALFRVMAREFARMHYSNDAINNDKVYTTTRIKYLQQILGERLFLQERIAPANYNDEIFRDYLISLKNAYLIGSKKDNIEDTASKFTGLDINIRELYLEARKPNSAYDVSDTHKMIVEVFVDDLLNSGRNLTQLANDLDFFINLIRPAHVLYDTNFIWTEQIDVNKVFDVYYGDTGGGCVPVYDYLPFEEPVYLALQIFVQSGPAGATGKIDSLHNDDLTLFLTDGTRVIVEPGVNGTLIFNSAGKRIWFDQLRIGQYVRINWIAIPGNFQFWWLPPELDPSSPSIFYRETIRKPIFQEFVKKVMDSKGRFPLQIRTTSTTICDRWVQDLLDPQYEDLRKNCDATSNSDYSYTTTISSRMGWPRLVLPYTPDEVYDSYLYGSSFVLKTPETPLTDGSGSPASPSDISVTYDSTALFNSVTSVDASSGKVYLTDSTSYWDSTVGGLPAIGDVFDLGYSYSLDGTDTSSAASLVFGISHWQMPKNPLVDSSGNLADSSDVSVYVDGTQISDAVLSVRPLLGHVTLEDTTSFWSASELGRIPVVGDQIEFDFYYGKNYPYSILLDDPERVLDAYSNNQSVNYTLVLDGVLNDSSGSAPISQTSSREIGYRYRAYLLHHTSVLNSPDTFRLNNYQKPALRASLANQQHSLNHLNLFFSPEFLTDTSQNIVLDDKYLENGLDPVLKLKEGTPPFQKTFSYHPGLVYDRNLLDIRQHRHPLMYADLLLKEFRDDGDSVPLSSICDSEPYTFKIRFTEELEPLKECDPWILTDTVKYDSIQIELPGERTGVPNLRVSSKKLRDNFILRETSSTGLFQITYTTDIPDETNDPEFYLPETTEQSTDYGLVDFPSLPILKNPTTYADASDVEVIINGMSLTGVIQSFNPVTGYIKLHLPSFLMFEHVVLTQEQIDNGGMYLSSVYLRDPDNVTLSIVSGTGQVPDSDFYVFEGELIWRGSGLEDLLAAGDELEIIYDTSPPVTFKYNVSNETVIQVINSYYSRILDDDYVFGSACPDPIQMNVNARFNEYVNYLDDYSSGIKIVYFNKDTFQVEEHVFSGPVFESYESSEDEISSPDSFPNAKVRIQTSTHTGNPLQHLNSYSFINDTAVKFRKKTFRELLPDRTFRTMKIMEMMPV